MTSRVNLDLRLRGPCYDGSVVLTDGVSPVSRSQVIQDGSPMLAEMCTPLGRFAYPQDWTQDTIVADIIRGQLHDWRVAEAIVRYWEPETSILDVGCNLGQMSVCVARATQRLAGITGQTLVVAVEARPSLAAVASENFKLNQVHGVVVARGAWSESGQKLPLTNVDFEAFASAGSLGVANSDCDAEEQTETITLDELSIDRRVSVIKLDIQGSELAALIGGRKLIARDSPVIIFEFEEMFAPQFGVCFADYIDLLDDLGYKIREVVGSNNYLAISEKRFNDSYAEIFDSRRRRMSEGDFMQLCTT